MSVSYHPPLLATAFVGLVLANFHGRYHAHGNLGKVIWIVLTNFHGRYRAQGNLGRSPLSNFHGRGSAHGNFLRQSRSPFPNFHWRGSAHGNLLRRSRSPLPNFHGRGSAHGNLLRRSSTPWRPDTGFLKRRTRSLRKWMASTHFLFQRFLNQGLDCRPSNVIVLEERN